MKRHLHLVHHGAVGVVRSFVRRLECGCGHHYLCHLRPIGGRCFYPGCRCPLWTEARPQLRLVR